MEEAKVEVINESCGTGEAGPSKYLNGVLDCDWQGVLGYAKLIDLRKLKWSFGHALDV
jgi:hypothetical protein